MKRRVLVRHMLSAPLTLAAWPTVAAPTPKPAGYPIKQLRIVVPFPPGGAADILARPLALELSQRIGQPVIIDNKAGANTVIGVNHVATAPADGYPRGRVPSGCAAADGRNGRASSRRAGAGWAWIGTKDLSLVVHTRRIANRSGWTFMPRLPRHCVNRVTLTTATALRTNLKSDVRRLAWRARHLVMTATVVT